MTTKLVPFRLLAALGCLGAIGLAGCSQPTGELTGLVKSGSKLVVSGSVTAVGSDNIPHGTLIEPDGRYRLSGLPVGEVKLLVSSPNPGQRSKGRADAGQGSGRDREGRKPPAADVPPPDPEIVNKWFPISEDYSDLAKTPLRATVKPGSTMHDIELE